MAAPDTSIPRHFPAFIQGRHICLERIAKEHMPDLWSNLGFYQDSSILDWLPWTKPSNPDDLWTLFNRLQTDRGFIIYAVIGSANHTHASDPSTLSPSKRDALGTIGFLDISTQHRTIETGAVLFGSALKRSTAATEAHFLLLCSICDPGHGPGYRRIAWKNNNLNAASRRAAERIGYIYEGTWRNHMLQNGKSRDTDWLSITDAEWPGVRQALEAWLHDDNFDDFGKQIRSLESVRETIKRA